MPCIFRLSLVKLSCLLPCVCERLPRVALMVGLLAARLVIIIHAIDELKAYVLVSLTFQDELKCLKIKELKFIT